MSYAFTPNRVSGIDVYNRDVVVLRKGCNGGTGCAKRDVVTEFSEDSRKRLAFVAANTSIKFRTMVTLTYPAEYPSDGKQVKAHLHTFLTWFTRKYSSSYLWFLEFQKRVAPHYHLVSAYTIPRGRGAEQEMYSDVAREWYAIVDSGDPRHLAAGTRVERIRKPDGAARYAVKYALKMYQKQVPDEYQDVGRFWGNSRDVTPFPVVSAQCTADDIMGVCQGLPFGPKDSEHIWSVLYGKAEAFNRWLDTSD